MVQKLDTAQLWVSQRNRFFKAQLEFKKKTHLANFGHFILLLVFLFYSSEMTTKNLQKKRYVMITSCKDTLIIVLKEEKKATFFLQGKTFDMNKTHQTVKYFTHTHTHKKRF